MTYIEVVHQNLHMQGFARGGDFMYWSFTDNLVKTTLAGTVKCQVEMHDGHLGDCDYYDGKIYASMLGHPAPGRPWNDWSSFCIYVYSADDLRLLQKIRLEICEKYWAQRGTDADTRGFSGVDGVTVAPDPKTGEAKLFVACALDTDERFTDQILLQFTLDGEYETEYRIPTGNTVFGIQNLDYDWENGEFWFSTYGPERDFQPKETLYCVSGDLTKLLRKYAYSSPYGIECLGKEGFLASVQFGVNKNRGGVAYSCTEEQFRLPAPEKFMTAHCTEENLRFMREILEAIYKTNEENTL